MCRLFSLLQVVIERYRWSNIMQLQDNTTWGCKESWSNYTVWVELRRPIVTKREWKTDFFPGIELISSVCQIGFQTLVPSSIPRWRSVFPFPLRLCNSTNALHFHQLRIFTQLCWKYSCAARWLNIFIEWRYTQAGVLKRKWMECNRTWWKIWKAKKPTIK